MRRQFPFALALVLAAATFSLTAQTPAGTPAATQEKLYISLETTDQLAVVDLKTFKQTKTLKVGSHPHGQASPATQDKLYVAAEVGGTVTLIDTIRDEVVKTFDVGFGTEPQNGAITPDGRFLYQPSYAGYWQVFDTQKEQIIEYIHTLGIGHNTVMAPDGRFAYLLPIVGGPGHFARRRLVCPGPIQRSDGGRRARAQGRRHDPGRRGSSAGHDQPGRQRLYMNVDDLLGIPRHRHRGAEGHLESHLHAYARRRSGEKPIAWHCGRE